MSTYEPVYIDTEREKRKAEIAVLKNRVAYLTQQYDSMTWNRDRWLIRADKLARECANRDRGIRRLRRRLDRARREASGQAGWVPVERALPESDDEFLVRVVYVANGETHHAFEIDWFDGEHWHLSYPERSNTAVTHWRPLPPGPEGA